MTFRDDDQAVRARLTALERELSDKERQLERMSALEQENEKLRSEVAQLQKELDRYRIPPAPEPVEPPLGSGTEGPPTLTFRIIDPSGEMREQTLCQESIKIGKLESSHLRLDDEQVSRMHAAIVCEGSKVAVIDLGSSTGTFVNGVKVNKVALRHGDALQIGDTQIIIGISLF